MPSLPSGAGIGLKPRHYADVLALGRDGPISFVELHPQNYFGAGGPPHRWLEAVAERLPLSFHSVGLSLGSAPGPRMDQLHAEELNALARLTDRYGPAQVSDHLAWCATPDERFPDLLPLPMTHESLAHFADRIDHVQSRLGRPILVENPSRMLAFAGDDLSEAEFLNQLARRSGCGILLDLNNVEVSAINLGLSPLDYLRQIDLVHVGEIHMAGHAIEQHDGMPLAIDDHGSAPTELCWSLLAHVLGRAGPRPVLIEWDTDIPDFSVLLAQATRADAMVKAAAAPGGGRRVAA